MPTNQETRQTLTAQIVEALKQNQIPWRKPWSSDPNAGLPTSMTTNKRYSGINLLLLDHHATKHGFSSKYWATFKQWKSKGCKVKSRPYDVKPCKWGCKVCWFSLVDIEDKNGEEKQVPFLKTYTVFNADQVSGKYAESLTCNKSDTQHDPDFNAAQSLVDAVGAKVIHGGNQAFYSPSTDHIQMPNLTQFNTEIDYWATLFHEHGHWSEKRLEWNGEYALGELIAELTSCMLMTELNLPQSQDLTNHQAYLSNWLKAMDDDPRFLFMASSQASKVCDFLLSHQKQQKVAA